MTFDKFCFPTDCKFVESCAFMWAQIRLHRRDNASCQNSSHKDAKPSENFWEAFSLWLCVLSLFRPFAGWEESISLCKFRPKRSFIQLQDLKSDVYTNHFQMSSFGVWHANVSLPFDHYEITNGKTRKNECQCSSLNSDLVSEAPPNQRYTFK